MKEGFVCLYGIIKRKLFAWICFDVRRATLRFEKKKEKEKAKNA